MIIDCISFLNVNQFDDVKYKLRVFIDSKDYIIYMAILMNKIVFGNKKIESISNNIDLLILSS